MDKFNREAELNQHYVEAERLRNAAIYKDGADLAGCSTSTHSVDQCSTASEYARSVSIVERAQRIVNEHASNQSRANRAAELLYLTEKHPEFARFYDLARDL